MENETLRAENKRLNHEAAAMRQQLETCAATFERYTAMHRAKGTPEADTKADQNMEIAIDCRAALAGSAGQAVSTYVAELEVTIAALRDMMNTPLFEDFTEAVKREAAHQVQRWGKAHDRSKSAENWYWLVGFLSGKALRSAITGDREKALHHTISSAAALMQWHAAIKADDTGTGLGADEDLKAKEA